MVTKDLTYWTGRARQAKRHDKALIEGRFVDPRGGATFEKSSPIDGRRLATMPAGSAEDVEAAVASGRAAFEDGRWSGMPVAARKKILSRLADLVEANADELAVLEVLDVGKPVRDAVQIDLPLALGVLRYAAEASDKVFGTVTPADARTLAVTARYPRGVVGGIIGWNFPLVLAIQKLAPALATGNSLVLKPSELSSFSALRLGELALEAGVPPGVFNVLPGLGATIGAGLSSHGDVDMVTFTGSSATGKKIMQAAGASNLKQVLLECGGKSANIVCEDCPDLEAVADGVSARMFWNQGQVCTAGTRLLVAESIRSELVELILHRASGLVAGDPLDSDTTFGAIASRPQMDKVLRYIESGTASGARLSLGGRQVREASGGFYVEPTVFEDVRETMTIAREEIFGPVLSVMSFESIAEAIRLANFGPVLSVMSFESIAEAIRLANSTPYGLSATVWTQSAPVIQQMMSGLRVGEITINTVARPTGGAQFGTMPLEPHKHSGFGVESGLEGLKTYTIQKAVQIHS